MYNIKYEIQLQDSEMVYLYGKDFSSDTVTFNRYHHKMLTQLYDAVLKTGFPVKVTDKEDNSVQIIDSQKEFDVWITTTQCFNIENRNK